MLPASKSHRFSLADVMPSSLLSLEGKSNPLHLAAATKSIVVLADGLGAAALAARAGHSRTLAPLLAPRSIIGAGFPTTTASALATLATGQAPGMHGLVGYSVFDPATDRVVNQLTGWDAQMDPLSWQRVPTVFERAAAANIASFAIGPKRYADSGFSQAVLRGAEYCGAESIAARFAEARRLCDATDRGLFYVYVPELDQAGHAHGWQSDKWTAALEDLDGAVADFTATLGRGEGMLLTADHGVIDVPESSHVLFDLNAGLVDGIRHVAGEPRAIQLHFEPDASAELRAKVLGHWRETEGHRSWIVSRAEAIESGWFGPTVHADVAPRIGDIIVAARKAIAYYDSRPADQRGRGMIGQHGSWSPEETSIPLLRFGAHARG